MVIKAANEFKSRARAINQLWQTDFTYLKITGWGWYYLSTVLDDFSRYIVTWRLGPTMCASDVTATLDQALTHSFIDHVNLQSSNLGFLSDNGSQFRLSFVEPEDDGRCDADGGHEGMCASIVTGVDVPLQSLAAERISILCRLR